MGIYYYAVDESNKEYFSAPDEYSIKSPGIFHPGNPFAHMVVMKNIYGSHFEIWNDCSNNIPPSDDYRDITDEVYEQYLNKFKDFFQPELSKREDRPLL